MKLKLISFLIINSLFVNTLATYGYASNPSVVFIPSSTPAPITDTHHYHAVVPIKQYTANYHSVVPVKTFTALDKGLSTQYHAQDSLGQYTYGYSTANGIDKNEARSADGTVVGGYSYVSPEGQHVVIKYTAGEGGFQATGNVIPQQVEPTPEVAQATYEHMKAKAEAKAMSENPDLTYSLYPYVYTYPTGYNGYTFYNTHFQPQSVEKMNAHTYKNMNMDKMLYNYKFSY